MNFLVDTHSHIYYDQYEDDLSKVINDAEDSEIKRIVCVGTDIETSYKSIEIANKYDNVFCTVGCHPHIDHNICVSEYQLKSSFNYLDSILGNKVGIESIS